MSSEAVTEALRDAQPLVYGAVAVAALIGWRRHPGRPSAWLAATLGVLAVVTAAGWLLPDDTSNPQVLWARKAMLAVLVLFPYCLYRFMTSLVRRKRWIDIAAAILTGVLIVGGLALPELPGRGESRPAWFEIYIIVLLIQWVTLSGMVAVRLWRSGRGQPAVARRRMRTMSLGATALALALVVAGEFSNTGATGLIVQLLVLPAGPLMLVGFVPPFVLRVLWRRTEEPVVSRAGLAMMEATSDAEVARALLPCARMLLGAPVAVLADENGKVIASEGAGDDAVSPVGRPDASQGSVLSLPVDSARLVIATGPLTPFFGDDEMLRVRELATLGGLALIRNRLIDSQRRLAAVVESSGDAILTKELDGTIVSWNRGAENIYGYRPDEIVGKSVSTLVPPDMENDVPGILERVRSGMVVAHYETKRRRKDGKVIDVSLTVSPVRDESGKVIGASTIARDVTEGKEIERRLSNSQAQLAEAQRTAAMGSWAWDVASNEITWSDGLYKILGYERDVVEPDAERFYSRIHPDDRARLEEAVERALATHEPLYERYRVSLPDGSIRTVEGRGSVQVEDGSIVSMTGTAQDITDRERVQSELDNQRQMLSAIFETSPDIIATISSRLELLYVNPAARQILGYEFNELFGENSLHWVHEGDLDAAAGLLQAAFGGDGLGSDRLRVRTAEDEWIWLDLRIRRMSTSDKAVVLARDITEQVELEEGLRRAKEEADEANRAKSRFLSRMSHELRTPMNAVLGFAQLLAMDVQTPDQKEGTTEILRAGNHLLELIDEVLDISRIEADRMRLSLEPVDAVAVATECVSLLGPLALQEGVNVMLRPGGIDRLPPVVADRQRLKQVLLNIIANGIKYNRRGGNVRVSIGQVDEGRRVRIDVTDTGRGIPADRLRELFVPFERLGAEGSGIEGTGLGLTLTKALVEAMQGTISVGSELGEGSTFSVEFEAKTGPAAPTDLENPAVPTAKGEAPERAPQTILYIEDNMSNLKLVERIVARRPDISLMSAMQGSLGLTLARDHQPDLILLDLDLPDIPGEKVLARLQSDPVTAEIPVVILSADAVPGQVRHLKGLGARDYLTKPLELDRFFRVLRDLLDPA